MTVWQASFISYHARLGRDIDWIVREMAKLAWPGDEPVTATAVLRHLLATSSREEIARVYHRESTSGER